MVNEAGVPATHNGPEEAELRISWEQDRRTRWMTLEGTLDATTSHHLAAGLAELGNRSLELDLTDAAWDDTALTDLIELIDRVGVRRCFVRCTDDLALDLAARFEEEWGELNYGHEVFGEDEVST